MKPTAKNAKPAEEKSNSDPRFPAALCAEKIPLAREIVVLDETTSTNDVVTRAARDGAAQGLLVFAESQTAGRGRLGRKWESARGKGLWFSLLLRPDLTREKWMRLTTWAAVALAEAIEKNTGAKAGIKWPNDLQIAGKKIAGILIETGTDKNGAPFAVLGVGVNVNQSREDFPTEISDLAGSLALACGREFHREKLALEIFRALENWSNKLGADFPKIVGAASARSVLLGKKIRLRAGAREIEGIAQQLDETGALVLRLADGSHFTAASGEATLAGYSSPRSD